MSTLWDKYQSLLHDSLDDIVQSSTVEAYYNHFQAIKELVSSAYPWLPEVYFADRFIYGLRSDIQPYVINCKPCTVFDACHLALIYEYSLRKETQQVHNIDNVVTISSNSEASVVECMDMIVAVDSELPELEEDSCNSDGKDEIYFITEVTEVQDIKCGQSKNAVTSMATSNSLGIVTDSQGIVTEDNESRNDIITVQQSKGYESAKFLTTTLFVDVADIKVPLPTLLHQNYLFSWEPGPLSVVSETRTYKGAESVIELTRVSVNKEVFVFKAIACMVLADMCSSTELIVDKLFLLEVSSKSVIKGPHKVTMSSSVIFTICFDPELVRSPYGNARVPIHSQVKHVGKSSVIATNCQGPSMRIYSLERGPSKWSLSRSTLRVSASAILHEKTIMIRYSCDCISKLNRGTSNNCIEKLSWLRNAASAIQPKIYERAQSDREQPATLVVHFHHRLMFCKKGNVLCVRLFDPGIMTDITVSSWLQGIISKISGKGLHTNVTIARVREGYRKANYTFLCCLHNLPMNFVYAGILNLWLYAAAPFEIFVWHIAWSLTVEFSTTLWSFRWTLCAVCRSFQSLNDEVPGVQSTTICDSFLLFSFASGMGAYYAGIYALGGVILWKIAGNSKAVLYALCEERVEPHYVQRFYVLTYYVPGPHGSTKFLRAIWEGLQHNSHVVLYFLFHREPHDISIKIHALLVWMQLEHTQSALIEAGLFRAAVFPSRTLPSERHSVLYSAKLPKFLCGGAAPTRLSVEPSELPDVYSSADNSVIKLQRSQKGKLNENNIVITSAHLSDLNTTALMFYHTKKAVSFNISTHEGLPISLYMAVVLQNLQDRYLVSIKDDTGLCSLSVMTTSIWLFDPGIFFKSTVDPKFRTVVSMAVIAWMPTTSTSIRTEVNLCSQDSLEGYSIIFSTNAYDGCVESSQEDISRVLTGNTKFQVRWWLSSWFSERSAGFILAIHIFDPGLSYLYEQKSKSSYPYWIMHHLIIFLSSD